MDLFLILYQPCVVYKQLTNLFTYLSSIVNNSLDRRVNLVDLTKILFLQTLGKKSQRQN